MASSFTFIPRSVSKGKTNTTPVSKPVNTGISQPNMSQARAGPSSSARVPGESAEKPNESSWDILALLELTLSDYAFWCNPELKHAVQSGHDGYVSLKYLMENVLDVTELRAPVSEVDLMKAARSSPIFDVRMMISEPSPNAWFGRNRHEAQASGFEIRRKDWPSIFSKESDSGRTRAEWDQYTIYIERMPINYRTKPAIARYLQTILSRLKGDDSTPKIYVQSITFPHHHSAGANEQPRCRGFAFIILNSLESVKTLCEAYTWEGISAFGGTDPDASKFGTRVLSKEKWDVLKNEYLAYQKQLLSGIPDNPEPLESTSTVHEEHPSIEAGSKTPSAPITVTRTQDEDAQVSYSWFPPNCLLFVRNVHPDTNKTTLRALFNRILPLTKDTIDYVDFTKGIDSCHLRFASPSAAAALVSHLTDNEVTQSDALDEVGAQRSSKRPKIEVELVQGKREEWYWEKVPQKARETALARLRSFQHSAESDQPTIEHQEGKRKRQRRN